MARHSESSAKSNEVDSSTDRVQRRRLMKHMVEKRRRNRINDTLEKMRVLVLKSLNKNPENYIKMEKLDIMEMTTNFLYMLNQQKTAAAMQPKPTHNYPGHMTSSHVTPQVHHPAHALQYRTGYATCQNEINNFFKTYELQQRQQQKINNMNTPANQQFGVHPSAPKGQLDAFVFSPVSHRNNSTVPRVSPMTSTPRSRESEVCKPLHVSTSFHNNQDELLESSLDNAVTSSTSCSVQSGLLCTLNHGQEESQLDINVQDISTSSSDSSVWRPW